MKWFQKPLGKTASPSSFSPTTATGSLLERECLRAQELGHPLTLLCLELANGADAFRVIGEERVEQTREELELVLRGTLRTTDILQPDSTDGFTILLPGTTAADAPTVVRNLRQAVHGYRILLPEGAQNYLRLQVYIAFASLPEDGLTAQALTTTLYERLEEQRRLPPAPPEDETSHTPPSLRLIA